LHVYAFTGLISASEARIGAELVLECLGDVHVYKGKNFYRTDDPGPGKLGSNLSIEIYPKQDETDDKGFGNLMRLPLGRNQKSKDPTFFVDMTSALGSLDPIDPMYALSDGYQPWDSYGD